jgi:carbon-monoxide dehydrogenase medium subunit
MQPYEYHAPRDLASALALLARHGAGAQAMAGGTSLVLLMKQGLVRPGHVVGLRGVAELHGISREADGSLVINACCTHREAERSPVVREHCPALAEAFSRVATVRIRNQATVGGNLAHADPAQDPPPILLALDAEVRLVSAGGERTVPLAAFFKDVFETDLREGELIRSIRIPPLRTGARATYLKFLPRTADDYATVGVAALLARDAAGRCTEARVALSAAGPVPVRAVAAERALTGSAVDAAAIRDAAELSADAAEPFDDVRGSAAYKKDMVRVFVRRALEAVARA